MKTNLITKIVLTLALVMQFALTVQAQVEGNDRGNGGGGVVQDGRYMTFYSAGLYVDRNDLTLEQVPQLRYLMDLMMTTPLLGSDISAIYANALNVSDARKYYNVQVNKFTPETKARLIAEYSRLTGLDANRLALFAITDIPNKVTYLMPEFYQLRPTEQAAILFHEAFWIVNPKATYQKVVDVEVSFQRYLENMQSGAAALNWLSNIVDPNRVLNAVLNLDKQSGALSLITKKNKLMIKDLLGQEAMNLYWVDKSWSEGGSDAALRNLYSLNKSMPQSLTIEFLINKLSSGYKLQASARSSSGYHQDIIDYTKDGYLEMNINRLTGLSYVAKYKDITTRITFSLAND